MFRFRLFSADGDDLGEFVTAVPNWSVGDTFTTGDGRRFRIRAFIDSEDLEPDMPVIGLWEVEPA